MIEVLGWTVTQQMILTGAVIGLTYALLAAGLVLVYRSSGVINFAHAEVGAFGALLLALMVENYGVNFWAALVLAVVAGAGISGVVELTGVRRLFDAPRVVISIATVGVAQLVFFATLTLPAIQTGAGFPSPFLPGRDFGIFGLFDLPTQFDITNNLILRSREFSVLLLAPAAILLLSWFVTGTRFGLAVRASADNPDTARLFGISVKQASTIVWVLAGGFAVFTTVLSAPLVGISASAGALSLGPGLLLRALTVALIARMTSLPITILGGLGVGIVEAIVIRNSADPSVINVWLFVFVVVIVLVQRRQAASEGEWSLSPKIREIPERLRALWWVRRLPQIASVVGLLVLAAVPLVFTQASEQFLWTLVVIYAMAALSVTVLTGWSGQLSLGQFAFVGLGAMVTVTLYQRNDLPFLLALVIASAVGVVASFIIGIPALRVRGLYLAVATLAFAVAAGSWLLNQAFLLGDGSSVPSLDRPGIGPLDFGDRRTYYWFCLAVLLLVILAVARLRRTGVYRTMVAVRENEEAASAYTVSPARAKLTAFAVAGGIAALAGGLLAVLLPGFTPSVEFEPNESIRVLAIAIIGGLGSITGAVLGSIYVLGLPAALGHSQQVALLTSGVGLLVLLMYFPGGLVQILYMLRDATLRWADSRMGDIGPDPRKAAIEAAVPSRPARPEAELAPGVPSLATTGVTVTFGGVVAVNEASIVVNDGELVGLIGTNGAGKTTFMNAIGGFVRMTGGVEVLGRDVSRLSPARRHAVGIGRIFQNARLFGGLTVRDTLRVGLEAREPSLLVPSMFALPPSPTSERRKRVESDELIGFLGLGRYADTHIAELSTGTRRVVELAGLLAVDARVLLLDEPTAGVAQRETEAFGPLIRRIQSELGASILLIEHDMPLVMSISDRIYCLEAGAIIAEGPPGVVRDDPLVIASYLGTEERAIRRSGAQAQPAGDAGG